MTTYLNQAQFNTMLHEEAKKRRDYVAALYLSGMKPAEICELLGITRQRLSVILLRAGIKRKRGRTPRALQPKPKGD